MAEAGDDSQMKGEEQVDTSSLPAKGEFNLSKFFSAPDQTNSSSIVLLPFYPIDCLDGQPLQLQGLVELDPLLPD